MEPKGLVEFRDEFCRQSSDAFADSLDGDRSDLLGLGFRVSVEPGAGGLEQDLEGIDAGGVGGDGHHGHHAALEAFGRAVGSVVADDDRRPALVGLRATRRFEIDETDLASTHQLTPPATAASQTSSSPLSDHSARADSSAAPISLARRSRTALCRTADLDA